MCLLVRNKIVLRNRLFFTLTRRGIDFVVFADTSL